MPLNSCPDVCSPACVKRACLCADDLDTRLLRAMVIKGILEQITTSTVNLVNADLLAKNRGLRIRETFVFAEGKVGPVALSLVRQHHWC